jgi:hypothetical protein
MDPENGHEDPGQKDPEQKDAACGCSGDTDCCSSERGDRVPNPGEGCGCGAPPPRRNWIRFGIASAVILAAIGVGAYSLKVKSSPKAGAAPAGSAACAAACSTAAGADSGGMGGCAGSDCCGGK